MNTYTSLPHATSRALHTAALAFSQHPELGPPDLFKKILGGVVKQFDRWLPEEGPEVVFEAPPITEVRQKRPQPAKTEKKPIRLADVPNIPREELEDLSFEESLWDPEPQTPELDAASCRALLLEVVRRAAYDWILYRNSTKLQQRELANDAYQWLFVEDTSSACWQDRLSEDRTLTSLVTICEVLDLDRTFTRNTIRNLTIKDVLSVGRPAEHRRVVNEDGVSDDYMPLHVDVDFDSITTGDSVLGG